MNRMKHGRTHRRKAQGREHTRNVTAWRVTASWDSRPDRPAVRTTSDRKARDRMVREWAADGAYVIVEEAAGFEWRTLREVNGAEQLLADERAAREQAEADAREARHRADYDQQAAVNRAAALLAIAAERVDLAVLMRRPPIARQATGQSTARHITGSQR
ncbi:hypothetical protein OG323_22700 [Streptomyces cyaneofuscatus]|uniref:hypothetical protein n=1 Tax=Streptomyces cyaneofuscatus TaxID=66883 RepID=UPI00386A1CC4|nr:hypothetical protein OG323_22700 [Streptomyces cyaneofuscatus]